MKNLIILLLVASTHLLFGQANDLKKAQKQFSLKNYSRVVDLLKAKQATDLQTLILLGKAHFHLKQYKKSISYFEKTVKSNPQSAELQYWLGTANFAMLRSDIPFNKKGYYAHKVRKLFKLALKLDSSHVKARQELARYYLNAPRIAGGSISKAKKHAEILKKYDKSASNELVLSIYLKTKDYKKAEEVYLTMVKEGKESQIIYFWLSEINYRQKEFKDAFDYCRQMMQKYPDYLMGYYQFAKIAAASKQQIPKGIKYAQLHLQKDQADKASPGNHWVYYRLGQLYQIKGDTNKANEAFKQALNLKPGFKQASKALNK